MNDYDNRPIPEARPDSPTYEEFTQSFIHGTPEQRTGLRYRDPSGRHVQVFPLGESDSWPPELVTHLDDTYGDFVPSGEITSETEIEDEVQATVNCNRGCKQCRPFRPFDEAFNIKTLDVTSLHDLSRNCNTVFFWLKDQAQK